MNYHLKNLITMRTALSVSLLFCVLFIALSLFLFAAPFSGFANIIMVFLTAIPFIVFPIILARDIRVRTFTDGLDFFILPNAAP